MASISNTVTFRPDPFHCSDAFQSYAMSSHPPPLSRRAQHEDLSRGSPTHSASGPPRPVNLPPLSSIDPRHQRPSHSPSLAEAQIQSKHSGLAEHVPHYGTVLPSMSPYYGPQLNASGQYVGLPSVSSAVASAGPRFPIAPTSDPNSMISAGRHKKEVKKRTKTGCMTCRKRRIKCDEGHPACRNCVKSKRECLGYDPIFKPQSPSSIQPAPHLHSPTSLDAPFHLRPPPYSSTTLIGRPESSATDNSPPSLGHSSQELHPDRSNSVATSTDTMSEPDMRQDAGERSRTEDQIIHRATQTNIDDLCWIDDQASTPVSASSHNESQNSEALRTIYCTSFGPGLDRLLETRWFSVDGYTSLSSDRSLLTQFENYVAAISQSPSVANQEARLVWALLCMCRRRPLPGFAGEFINDKEDTLDGDEVTEKRLDILEALITGRQLSSNPLPANAVASAQSSPPTLTHQLKTRELDFWQNVGDFVSTPLSDVDALERILSKSRKLLDHFETRDVVYSVMLMRHIGEKWHERKIGEADDERDSKDWLAAKGFLESEAQGQAMSHVVKRFCSMALRAWSV